MTVRVRFGPSPTGFAHIGTGRTFLFNWLFARNQGGACLIRIEDTDRDRFVPGATESLLDMVRWLGLDWDEGPEVGGPYAPYVQSQRLALYHEHADRLIGEGKAYRCYCSPERLDALRREQQARREPPGYDRRCRYMGERERAELEASGLPWIVRFAVPLEGSTTFGDLVHGDVTWENSKLDDFVILKSDGYPTYHLAHLVDDHHMHISHVLRADEWISSTPRHVLLYQALGWVPPLFAHLPPILGPDRKKLSKRHGPTTIGAFQKAGYLPEAMVNYLALCGWSPGTDEEVLPLNEVVRQFSLERVSRSGAIFDHAKLEWFNGVYIRSLPTPKLAARIRPFLPVPAQSQDTASLTPLAALIQDRLRTLSDTGDLTSYIFTEDVPYDAALLIQPGMDPAQTGQALASSGDLASTIEPFTHQELEPAFRTLCAELSLKTSQLFMAIRVACTGRTATPPLFQTMEVLGRERVVQRLQRAVGRLESQ